MSSSSAGRARSIRQRSRKACNPCRRRKRKCNGQLPCNTCIEFEYECEYGDEAQPEQTTQIASGQEQPPQQSPATTNYPAFNTASVSSPQKGMNKNFFEPAKHRYYDAGSAISFPRAIALSLKAGHSPRLHSFAYNVGLLPERFLSPPPARLPSMIHQIDAMAYASQYFLHINRIFFLVQQDTFNTDLVRLWNEPDSMSLQFETLACFVILLGSLFSWPNHFARQQDLADHAQAILDQSSFYHAPSVIHVDHAKAWVLRTLYLRFITRPNITWISSCITMHLIETLGMHKEYDTLGTADLPTPYMSPELLECRRRIFWSAWTLNRMISFELGRSATVVAYMNINMPQEILDTASKHMIEALLIIYPDGGHLPVADHHAALAAVSQYMETNSIQEPLVELLLADIACGLYRQIEKNNSNVEEAVGQRLVNTVQRGLNSAHVILQASQPWWWLISTPFQFICVAVAVGKPYILDALPQAIQLMQEVTRKFDSHMSREACETAQMILDVAIDARDKETASLRQALSSYVPLEQPTFANLNAPAATFDELLDLNFPFSGWEGS